MKKIDLYIAKKFFSTFLYTITLLSVIIIIFDISEKIEDYLQSQAPAGAIAFDYYLNFIPFFVNMFSPLFAFISVIFFTGRMAMRSEIIAMYNSGVSFGRLLLPYLACALVIAGVSVYLNNFVIPKANYIRLEFENTYLKRPYLNLDRNIHRQIGENTYLYFERYDNRRQIGYKFSLEEIKGGKIRYKLMADHVMWDSTLSRWKITNYYIRKIDGLKEQLESGLTLDSALNFHPSEFSSRISSIQTMNYPELVDLIEQEQKKGSESVTHYLLELHQRFAFPFATIILTLIGVCIASRKMRGGIGMHIGFGMLFAFAYILFMQVSVTFATNANLAPALAVWIPNVIYTALTGVLIAALPR